MVRTIPREAIKLIEAFEGFSPIIYICSGGYKTLGYGHAIKKGEKLDRPDILITEEEAFELLQQDILYAAAAVSRLITVSLSENQYSSLISFTFNLGSSALQRSTLRSMINRYEYLEASLEFPKWCWAGGKKLNGLLRRRIAERELFLWG